MSALGYRTWTLYKFLSVFKAAVIYIIYPCEKFCSAKKQNKKTDATHCFISLLQEIEVGWLLTHSENFACCFPIWLGTRLPFCFSFCWSFVPLLHATLSAVCSLAYGLLHWCEFVCSFQCLVNVLIYRFSCIQLWDLYLAFWCLLYLHTIYVYIYLFMMHYVYFGAVCPSTPSCLNCIKSYSTSLDAWLWVRFVFCTLWKKNIMGKMPWLMLPGFWSLTRCHCMLVPVCWLMANSKHWLTASFFQPLPELIMP